MMSTLIKKQHAGARKLLDIVLHKISTKSEDFGKYFITFCYVIGKVDDYGFVDTGEKPEKLSYSDYVKKLFSDYENQLKADGLLRDTWDIILENKEPIFATDTETEYTEEQKAAMYYEFEKENYFRR